MFIVGILREIRKKNMDEFSQLNNQDGSIREKGGVT